MPYGNYKNFKKGRFMNKEQNSYILYKNENENIIVTRTDFKKRSVIDVRTNNNPSHSIRKYRINNIPLYQHQYLSWQNLVNMCQDTPYLYTAVQNKTKLVSDFILDYDIKDDCPDLKSLYFKDFKEYQLQCNEYIKKYISDYKKKAMKCINAECGNINNDSENIYLNPWFNTSLCSEKGICTINSSIIFHYLIIRNGTLSDFYNWDEILEVYKSQGCDLKELLSKSEFNELKDVFYNMKLADMCLSYFNVVSNDLDSEFILTGLLLGYPIESTASILLGY